MGKKPTKPVQIPLALWREITAFLKRHGGYFNEAEYVREAVRWKLALDHLEERGKVSVFRLRYRGHSDGEETEQDRASESRDGA